MDPVYEDVNIRDLLEELKLFFDRDLISKGIEFIIEVKEDVPTSVTLDSLRVKQILLNLIGNAVKFTKKGFVKLKVELVNSNIKQEKLDLLLSVEDTGIGIPEKDLETIFMSFKQQSSSISRNYGGTGLGLAICKKLIEVLNGKIEVSSHVGKGSVFRVTLFGVVNSNSIHDTKKLMRQDKDIRFQKSKILVVDDEELNRMLLYELLKDRCDLVVCVDNAVSALTELKTQHYDLVIMDLVMPDIDGVAAVSQIKALEEYSKIPLVCCSANANNDDQQDSLKDHFDDYLVKPVRIDRLLKVLSKYLSYQEL